MPNAPRTARAVARAELTRAIVERATAQLAEVGPAQLSVRQIARDLDMASSAVYRYFPSRDDLLTALLVAAFDDLGAAVEAGVAEVPATDLRRRWRAITHGVRDWAVAHPHEYALIYGSPVPGYAAPASTVEPALRVSMALLTVVHEAQLAGREPAARPHPPSRAERSGIAPIMELLDPPLEPDWATRGVLAWATLFGTVSLELFGHMNNAVLDYEAHFDQVVEQLADDLGL